MFAEWPIARRIAASTVVALAVGVLLATLFDGLSPSYPVRLGQVVACVLASIVVIGLVVSFITSHLADYSEPADDEEFELLVRRTERLARENLAAEPDEAEFMTLDPRNPEDFEELVRQALDDLPDLLLRSLDHVGVMISDKGRRHRAYGLYQGDTVARDNFPDRIVMSPEAGEAEIEAVKAKLSTTGVHVLVLPGELTTAIGAIGDPEGVRELGLEGMAGVDRVVPISRPYKLASSELAHHEPTTFAVDRRLIGGNTRFCLIAGPCTVESREQTLGVARIVRAAGASMLRGGAFKPRTSPFAFKGLGVAGLEILAEARAETGLPVVTEFLDSAHAEALQEHADVLQIGARNMQNYALLEVAGRLGKPVLLKRGLSSSLDELLQAADYVLKEGEERVMLCERGIRTFETATRFTLDLGAVPWLKLHSHLPVIVDPSHASGDRRLVEPLARAAAAVGADGIIVEVHQDPDVALCDGPQALQAAHFADYARDVAAHASLLGKRLA